ncbi:MAG: DsrE family protein [Nitrospirae bacterium]|nr:DsrE family protein [Nitrospirota bacterium]MCL5236791.1 DsrE family protein [Nitrospirota bacterium]
MEKIQDQALSNDVCSNEVKDLFVVLCASGFDNSANARSALMFSALAAAANYKTKLYCIQNAVDLMVKGALEKRENPQPGIPTLAQRLREAIEMGVEIQCCSQTMANKKLMADDLIPGVTVAGAMNLIALSTEAKGTLCF